MSRKKSPTRRRPRSNPRGVLSVRSGGFGFVQTAEGEFFVPESKMGGAFDGDLVELAALPSERGRGGNGGQPCRGGGAASGPSRHDEKPAARVVRVVDRSHDTLVGTYEVAEPFGVVVPEDARIPYDVFTMRSAHPEIADGALVRVRITTFPSRNTAATGVIEEVLGMADDEDAAVELVVARHKLETEFSEGALLEACRSTLDEEGALAAGYRDVRGRFVLTIDPADARDFDDALSLDPVDGDEACDAGGAGCGRGSGVLNAGAGKAAWRLGVHIADVSHYVPWNSSLDLDARRRATSVYLVDRVIPMLPEQLSNELCSLKPGEVRRSMTADLFLDERGRLVRYELYPALIRSDARLSYDEAQALIDGGAQDGDGPVGWRLAALSRLAKLRARARETAGSIDFATAEAKVRLDDEGRPLSIDLRRKTDATSLVEEAMILANETVAAHLRDAGFPAVYRVHDRPAAESLEALIPVLQEFPWFKDIDRHALVAGNPHAIQAVLAASDGRPESDLVSTLVLRSMKRAVYKPVCDPHYGLASAAYLHFTSPIRRYPDLVVHRMLRAQLTRRPEKFDQEVSSLAWIAEHSSKMERLAEKAARESQEIKMIEYLQRCIGQTFSATVSGVASYGAYVRLDNTAEGLVHVKDLGAEYFALDPALHRLTGQDSGVSYRLGQRLPVVLSAADPRARRLDFRLAARG